MPSSGSALNLSLLSRGIGEISKNGHERIDVVFEPQDYFNFVGNSSRIYLPPIPPKYDFDGTPTTTKSRLRLMHEMPKTFTTRKGALLLFSEDQAYKTLSPHHKKGHHHHRKHHTEESLELSKSADDIELKTVDDLAKSILSFGKREPTDDTDIYLGFVHDYGRRKKDLFERQIRPGFSAKRYLSLWTKSWDDNVLGKVISKGYLTEKSLFYYNPLNPHLQRRLNDDMSHYPAPYKLMRSMLMSPGSLSGYTFYRVRPESADTVVTPEQVEQGRTPSQMGSIKVISTKDGVQKEVSYANLDKVAQEEVLTDLLVKSAVHYAMKKQQELIEESQREQAIPEVDESRSSIQQFDMRDAVESLLDSQRGKGAINTDFPEDKSEASSKSGSIKGRPLKKSKASSKDKATSPLPADFSDGEKEYFGSIPVASIRGEQSSVPQLPHIAGAMPLTPIGEASREGTRMTIPVSLPPIGQDQGIDGLPSLAILPPTPQHSNLSVSPTKTVVETKLKPQDEGTEEYSDESGVGVKTERTEQTERVEKERKRRVKKKLEIERTGPSLSGGYHLHSSSESLGPGSANSLPTARPIRTHWKGSTQSLKSDRSKKGSNTGSLPEDSSKKGSIIIAPDGEAVNVGGHIEAIVRPDHQHIENVGDANRLFGRGSRLSDILVDKYKKDLASDLESDEEPDAWKRRKGVQREDIRGYANKRDKVTPRQRRNVKSRQPIIKSRSNTVSTQNKTVRFSASSKDKDEGFEEIDYTAGDIDATLSMSSWSYMPRDFDPEFAGIAGKADRANSLPSMPFRTDDKSKDFTQHLSRATEKTEEGYEGEVTPEKTRVSVPVSKEDNTGQDRGISQTSLYGDTPGVDSVLTNLETPLTITEDNLGYASKLSRHDEEELNDNADQRSKASSRQSFQKQKSVSLSGKGSASKTNRDSRPASISEVEHRSLSRKDSRNSKISMRSMSKPSSHHEQDISLVDSLQGIEHEVMSQGEINTSVNEDTPQSGKGTISPPAENYSEGEKQDSDSRSSRKTASPIGTVAPSRPGSGQSIQSQQVSEKDIIDVLENTARQVAASTLSRSDSGQDLEKDARQAAELWLEKNAPRIISRSQSVQDTEGADEAIKAAVENGRKSAGPTAGEYKELIKEKLQTALSNTDGESIPLIPDDAELSPELLEALKNNSITPDDIEVIHDEETGKDIVRSRSQMSAAMGGVKEGHIYVPVGKNGNKQPGTIPTDRQSNVDIGDFEVINYGKVSDAGSKVGSAKTHSSKLSEKVSDKAPSEKSSEKGGKSQPPSVLGESIVEEEEQEDRKSPQRSVGQRSEEEVEEPEDEFKKAVEEAEKVSEAEQQKDEGAKSEAGQPSVASDDKKSIKSAVSEDKTSKVSIKTEKSDVEKKKPEKKKEEFVVGKVETKGELEKLFGEIGLPPPKPTTKKKGKPKDKGKKAGKKPAEKPAKGKGKKKEKEADSEPTKEPTPPPPPKEPTPPLPVEDKEASDNESDKESVATTQKSEESDFEFHFVRETPSPTPPPPPKPPSTVPSVEDEPTDEDEKQDGEDDEAARLRMISNREARAAKRAAQAAKRKEEVERKRREKEEQSKREKDEQERAEQLKREMEAERMKALEAKRLKKQLEEEERDREAMMEEEKLARQKAELEREKRRKEEYQRKLEEMKKKQAEEEQKRQEELLKRQREEEERRKAEEELMAQMAEEERIEYERKKKLEEEERKRKEEEDRRRREEEAQRAMEEARRLAEEMARKQAEMEARLKFNRSLQVEARGLDHSHNITEAFVFSYFELLNWFGLDIPEFDLLKINQY